jgi:integrase/recombinase XerD
MLTLYRRHKPTCPHFAEGRRYHHCKCRIWVDGILGGKEIRQSLDLRDWTKANKKVQEWEAKEEVTERPDPVTVADGWRSILADLEARKLSDSTIRKYKLLERQMTAFAEATGLHFLPEFDLDTLGKFRATWKDGPRTAGKKLERLRAFFHYAHQRRWVESNPATLLKAPRSSIRPTMPLKRDEMVKILAACDEYVSKTCKSGRLNAHRLKTLVLLMRYSGMRIGDAVSLSVERIEGKRLFLYTQKTGTPVYTVLPDFVLKALEKTPRLTPTLYFWSGVGKLESIVRSWQTRLRKLFELARVPKGQGNMLSHRFRDTFSVELLLAGVPIERVSILLGHQSVRITEKHYSPWISSRQEQLEADVQRAWADDPVIASQTAGTKEVQFPKGRIN